MWELGRATAHGNTEQSMHVYSSLLHHTLPSTYLHHTLYRASPLQPSTVLLCPILTPAPIARISTASTRTPVIHKPLRNRHFTIYSY